MRTRPITATGAIAVERGFSLDALDLDRRLPDKNTYEQELDRVQIEMLKVQQAVRAGDLRGIIVFEGWDAGGKGGTIQRLTARLDPRRLLVHEIAAPTPGEQGRHYLWRFWRRLPPRGHIAVFDRSWYGRVLVERVERLAPPMAWRRAYGEINEFERMLVDDGVRLVKIFLHISGEEQLKRLGERIADPNKHWKIAADDIRNYAKRAAYVDALDDVFAKTSTDHAPWKIVASDHKWFARVAAIKTAVAVLGAGLELKPPPIDKGVAKAAFKLLKNRETAVLGLKPADKR